MIQNPILINGQWRAAQSTKTFQPFNPNTGEKLTAVYPVSEWQDCDDALAAAQTAFAQLKRTPKKLIADFLNRYADKIEANAASIVDLAHLETGLPTSPRLADVELPRTVGQLRQAAKAAISCSWANPVIDTQNNIRSQLEAIGPVVVFGPNNFPLAFGSISGGDFAAAIAAGNPVIAKAHSSHPGTTKRFAELALEAVTEVGLPKATVQLIFAMSRESGFKLVSDARIGASGFTGSRPAGLSLKQAADQAGKPIYLELSSVNPVVVLPGALKEKGNEIAEAFAMSCLASTGQLCTKPGLLIVQEQESADEFIALITDKFNKGPIGTLLSPHAADHIMQTSSELVAAGAALLSDRAQLETGRFCQSNTLLSVSAESFVQDAETFQKEMFGNASLIIRSHSPQQTLAVVEKLEGNLTGCIYSHSGGEDDQSYDLIAPQLVEKVGRLLNDKMPTGVAVSPAMNHGGPFPASGHPGFTAVGLPASIKRFTALKCYDNVRPARLPELLQDQNPGQIWRQIDGVWSQLDVKA